MNVTPVADRVYVIDPDFPEGPHQRITPEYARTALRRGEAAPTDRPGFLVLCPVPGLRKLSGAEARRNHLRRSKR